MGNTVATPSNDRRPSHVSVTRSLRKMTSSSTLSSLRLYRQSNRSETSVLSRHSNSSGRDKILDISKPTQVEHGIHVEYNNGRYMVISCTHKKKKTFVEQNLLGLTRCMATIEFTE